MKKLFLTVVVLGFLFAVVSCKSPGEKAKKAMDDLIEEVQEDMDTLEEEMTGEETMEADTAAAEVEEETE